MGDNYLSESKTRKLIIDNLLREAHWDVSNHSHVIEEFNIGALSKGKHPVAQNQPDLNPSGFSDYLLLDRANNPLAIVEAKRTSRDPIAGKQQAEDYADEIMKYYEIEPFIFLTNGYEIWYWNRPRYGLEMVHGFFRREDLERIQFQNKHRKGLHSISINPSIIDRDYQIEALKRVYDGLESNKRKFLLVMATGTGKTRVAMALIDVLLHAHWAEKILFLVDRDALAKQAFSDGFKRHLPNESRSRIASGIIETSDRLFVSTIQTMMECFTKVSPGFFDVIISDECHRSIYNKWRDVLSYFHAIQIGLTATPSECIERDTFKFFQCEGNVPTFNYSFDSAIQEGYLVDFRPAYAARTNFQIEGIKGNELPPSIQKQLIEQGFSPDDIDFEGTDLERKVTNIGTNEALIHEFMDVSIKDDSGIIPGKSIIFAISHNHARRLWELFNELYPEFGGRLVEIIDSKMERPLRLIDRFKTDDYPRVAISVDMLDSGIDVPEVVNLVFAKPVFSKIKFWQMIGRGTRKLDKLNIKLWCTQKDRFLIIDHWNNFEYFNLKPEGEPPFIQIPIPVSVFKIRLEKLRIFKQQNDRDNFEKTKDLILAQINSLPDNSIAVRENKRAIEKSKSENFWNNFNDNSLNFLSVEIAPLMRFMIDINIYQAVFLLKTELLSLALIKNEQIKIEHLKKAIIYDINHLPLNLLAVHEKDEHIRRVKAEAFWQNLDYEKCEYIRDNLTDIMKYKMIDEKSIVKLNIDDIIATRKWIEFGPEGQGDYVIKYRQKIEEKILQLAEKNPILNKIKNGIPVNDSDIEELENMLNSPELYIAEENLRKTFEQPYGTLVQFVKSILGKYQFPDPKQLIKESFNTYVVERNNKTPLSAEQLRFLRTVSNVFAEKKHIEYEDLFEPPFTQFGTDAATRLFTEAELHEIIGILGSN
ncbi:MAG: hypothetical protein A2Y62_09880 [Candidatus Fischerbacteria bacterium RBG_13_37_8]|uniref:Helicase ATP-binding domain-containing protein n=1 Tax=Candidatus Fischerbacteria bacterium RBG_13_37_8 TaxID=1817863 RepID=A0A1F5V5W3_9BACT|nr:MAG: hypothetical protein A2Y62_09880 [Candidatus Fischerbacteria bacterium RBG_13_37_8]